MKLITQSRWRFLDWGIIIASFLLVLISLATLYSLELNQETPDFSLLERQMIAAGIGVAFFFIFIFIDFRHLKDLVYILYGTGILLLIAVLIWGTTIRGTTRWFNFGGITFQPVELIKIILIIVLATYFDKVGKCNRLIDFAASFLFFLIPATLIYLQPDVGSLLVLFVIWMGFVFVMRLKPMYIGLFIICSLLFSLFAWQYMLEPYQKERLSIFLHPGQDPYGAGYNVIQSKIAVGSGALLGRGLGLGTQSSLNFLPEQETDFIFAVIAESLGFFGAALVIFLYTYLLWRLLALTHILNDDFAVLLTMGVFFWFAFQGFSNIAMNMGLAPVFGVPLPFLSYGGSSLMINILAIGIIESAAIYSKQKMGE